MLLFDISKKIGTKPNLIETQNETIQVISNFNIDGVLKLYNGAQGCRAIFPK
jgi:hypothetical protein